MSNDRVDKNCLSFWFPKLHEAGIPVPLTTILEITDAARSEIWGAFDGKQPGDGLAEFCRQIEMAAAEIGYPVFFRTGQTSYKHAWEKTCRLGRDSDIAQHVFALTEFSECADMIGLPWNVWVIREMLPTTPIAILPGYGNFPLVKEVRCFVRGGTVQCAHAYWPTNAILAGLQTRETRRLEMTDRAAFETEQYRDLKESERIAEICQDLSDQSFMPLAKGIAEVFKDDEPFSVDLLPTERGWFCTDMALASRSFHWEGCEHAG